MWSPQSERERFTVNEATRRARRLRGLADQQAMMREAIRVLADALHAYPERGGGPLAPTLPPP